MLWTSTAAICCGGCSCCCFFGRGGGSFWAASGLACRRLQVGTQTGACWVQHNAQQPLASHEAALVCVSLGDRDKSYRAFVYPPLGQSLPHGHHCQLLQVVVFSCSPNPVERPCHQAQHNAPPARLPTWGCASCCRRAARCATYASPSQSWGCTATYSCTSRLAPGRRP